MSFTRNIENFVCEHCGNKVMGSGYTNHCPKCLWSKHVDIEPGDRAETCKGLMEPIGSELDHGDSVIIQRCTVCGKIKKNRMTKEDNFDIIVGI